MFDKVKSALTKSEAAVIVQNALEHQASMGLFDRAPAKTANAMIESLWRKYPNIFDDDSNTKPFKLTTAMFSLAFVVRLSYENPTEYFPAFFLSLVALIEEMQANGYKYPLNEVDKRFLNGAIEIGEIAMNHIEENGGFPDEINDATLTPYKYSSS